MLLHAHTRRRRWQTCEWVDKVLELPQYVHRLREASVDGALLLSLEGTLCARGGGGVVCCRGGGGMSVSGVSHPPD